MKDILAMRESLFGDQESDDFLDLAVDRLKKLRGMSVINSLPVSF